MIMKTKRRTNNSICLSISFLCLLCLGRGSVHAQEVQVYEQKRDTVYIYKRDTITIRESSLLTTEPEISITARPERRTNNTFSFGIGAANMYDTYLSPLEYKGTSIRLSYEQMRRTMWFNYKFYKQQIFDLELALGDNPAKNATDYFFQFNYRIGGHYDIFQSPFIGNSFFRLGVGGLWDTSLGVLYNDRNGNNPASARANSNLDLSVQASLKIKNIAVRWQLDTPMIGILFSPEYGQSYYEISLGNSAKVVNFASLHNQRALRNYITVDIPIKSYIIRAGYLGSYYQTKVHNLQTHHYTHSFVLGFPLEGIKYRRSKASNNYWDAR